MALSTKTKKATALAAVAPTEIARAVQVAARAKKPTAAARLDRLEPQVESLTGELSGYAVTLRQVSAGHALLAQDLAVKVDQIQLDSALHRLEALERRPLVELPQLQNLHAQVLAFLCLAVGVSAAGLFLVRVSPPPAPPIASPPLPIASPTISPTDIPDVKTPKSKKRGYSAN